MRKYSITNISLITLILLTLSSCISTKRVDKGEYLLEKNIVYINGKRDFNFENLKYIRQQPNKKFFGFYPFFLEMYNLADVDPNQRVEEIEANNKTTYGLVKWIFSDKAVRGLESDYVSVQNWLKESGEEPVLVDDKKTEFSRSQLNQLYRNNGYFLVKTKDSTIYDGKKSTVKYYINTGPAYFIDSVDYQIETPFLKDMYLAEIKNSFLKKGVQYSQDDFYREQNRLTELFRNNGVYNFQRQFVSFIADTNRGNHLVDIKILISDYPVQTSYGIDYVPHKIYKVNKVNIYPDNDYTNQGQAITDSVQSRGYFFLAKGKNRFKPRALIDAIYFEPGKTYSDQDRRESIKLLSRLGMFKITDIKLIPDSTDKSGNGLISQIYLTPLKRNTTKIELEGTNSNTLGLGLASNLSFTNRNTFGGAEILDISFNVMVGNQKDVSINNDALFNAYQYGMQAALHFPRFLLPWDTENMVPKRMRPRTTITGSFNNQLNIGLSNNSYNTAIDYVWNESESKEHSITLYNFQYIKYLNSRSDYYRANPAERINIEDTQDNFIAANPQYINQKGSDALLYVILNDPSFQSSPDYITFANSVQRYQRLTQDYLISSFSYSFTYNNQLENKDKSFLYLRLKGELAGSLFSVIDKISPLQKIQTGPDFYAKTIFNLPYAQFAKFDLDFRKYWKLNETDKIAFRFTSGVTIPFGNSQNIPFERAYFSGGVSDVRAWKPYELGPGGVVNYPYDYSYDKMKITLGLEYRAKIFGKLHGALFVDAGNIWGLGEDISAANFQIYRFYKEFGVGTGYGIRYDFNFFVFRFDFGYKAYDPNKPEGQRWVFGQQGFFKPQVNFAIGYPF